MAFFQTTVGAIILLIVGFVLLVKGADFFVEGASSVAKRLKIPALIRVTRPEGQKEASARQTTRPHWILSIHTWKTQSYRLSQC